MARWAADAEESRRRSRATHGYRRRTPRGEAAKAPNGDAAADCAVSHARLPIFVSPGVDDAVGQYSSRSGCRASVQPLPDRLSLNPGLLPRTWPGPLHKRTRTMAANPPLLDRRCAHRPGPSCPAARGIAARLRPGIIVSGHCLGVTGRRTSPGRKLRPSLRASLFEARPPKFSRPALAEEC